MTTKKKDFDPVKFREEKYSEITNKMVEAIKQYLSGEKENLPWVKPWKSFGKFRNPVTGTKYSGMNIFILAMENYDDPRWVTWKNAKKLGGNVKEGEVPTTIVHYSLIKRKRDKENDNGEKFEEAYYFRVPTFKNVYNVTQCENLELEPLINEDEVPCKFEKNEVAAKIINNYLENGPSLEIGGDKAFYSPLKDQIGMPDLKYFHNPEGYYTHFVIHGQQTVNQNRPNDRWKGDGFENVYITWTYGLADRNITSLKEVMNDYYGIGWEADNAGPDDPGWSSGATAMYIGCKLEEPKTCYLIGMDMYSTTDFINNLYKETQGYVSADESAITPQNWVVQMGRVMVRYKDIQFIKVNPDENNKISERMPQWDSLPNLSYMKKSEFYAKLSLDF